MLIVFDDKIAYIFVNKKRNPIVTELFTGGRKRNISLAFITQSYFAVPKNIKLNSTHYLLFNYENSKQMRVSANCI